MDDIGDMNDMDDMDDMGEIVQEFLVESHENLDQLDRDLVALEREPDSRELLSSVFRTIHTIKGTSGFLAFPRLEQVTHAGESLLSRLRDGELRMTPATTDTLLRMVDVVRALLASIEASGGEGEVDVAAVVAEVTACLAPPDPGPPAPAPMAPVAPVAPSDSTAPGGKEAETTGRRRVAESTIRVDVDLLESLMRLVGELVLTRNQVVRYASDQRDMTLLRASQRLNLIASELQAGVMKTRMQPIDHVWSKLPRVVRDLGAQCGRAVRLEMEGRQTEVDRSLLEAIKDPLTHLVRNAVDHGIESPAVRVAAGKPAQGVLTLRAFHEGGQVILEVSDDGAGIDAAAVAAKAVERGLATRNQVAAMSERELIDLVFQPGFSTAEAVTAVSGRGVGMDVVRTNIERIGGTVELNSIVGLGTTVRIKIPLTLAIIPAVTVECVGDRYAIPQVSLLELVTLTAEEGPGGIEYVGGAPVHRLRGDLLPLVRLDESLGLTRHDWHLEGAFVAVLQAEGRRFGLVVDRVLDSEEIVVKPLTSLLKGIGVYSGATILGDGRVALIIDVPALARRSRLQVEATATGRAPDRHVGGGQAERMLVVGVGGDRRVAIPVSMVTRLENFSAERLERVGSREVVQYEDRILPVVRLAEHLGVPGRSDADNLPAVVYRRNGRGVALIVERIVDIVEERPAVESDLADAGTLGSAVIQGKVTELLDVREAILAADPAFFDAGEVPRQAREDERVSG